MCDHALQTTTGCLLEGPVGMGMEVFSPNYLLNPHVLRPLDEHDHVVGVEFGRAALV